MLTQQTECYWQKPHRPILATGVFVTLVKRKYCTNFAICTVCTASISAFLTCHLAQHVNTALHKHSITRSGVSGFTSCINHQTLLNTSVSAMEYENIHTACTVKYIFLLLTPDEGGIIYPSEPPFSKQP